MSIATEWYRLHSVRQHLFEFYILLTLLSMAHTPDDSCCYRKLYVRHFIVVSFVDFLHFAPIAAESDICLVIF